VHDRIREQIRSATSSFRWQGKPQETVISTRLRRNQRKRPAAGVMHKNAARRHGGICLASCFSHNQRRSSANGRTKRYANANQTLHVHVQSRITSGLLTARTKPIGVLWRNPRTNAQSRQLLGTEAVPLKTNVCVMLSWVIHRQQKAQARR